MKIAMLGQKGIPAIFGGVERHVEELSCRLAARGHEVLVYCRPWYLHQNLEPKTENLENQPTCITIPTIMTKHLDTIVHTTLATIHALHQNPEIYHYHGVGPSLVSWLPRLIRPKARVITTFHCVDRKHRKWGFLARLMLRLGEWTTCRFAHATITVSRTLEQYCQDVYETKTNHIPNGVAEPQMVGQTLIKRFGLEKNQYLAQFSRLVEHKGAHHLIRAWKILERETPKLVANKKLAIVGDSVFTDNYVAELKALTQDDPSIVFTGFQSGAMLDELFANALFIVQPSESEGLPIAVLEAMSYGKVVLASDIPENMEVIALHGVSFRNTKVEDLKNKLIELLKNPEHLPEVGNRAQEFVLKKYHWNDITEQVLNLYQQTITAKQLSALNEIK